MSAPPTPRRLALSALLVLSLFAFAWGTHAVRAARAGAALPTGRAEWIWKPLGRSESSPSAFALVRDFYLDPPPARGRLLVSADEEYILYLNGQRIGSGRYTPAVPGKKGGGRGALLDSYEVGDLLTPGVNRLQAEVRSGRGAGGFLLALVDGLQAPGRPLLGTDESWRVYQRYHPFLLRGLVPLSPKLELGTGEDVFSWGLPPLGRWGIPTPGPERPLFSALTGGREGLAAVAAVAVVAGSRLVLSDPPAPGLPPVPRTLFDFGREVTGYLSLDLEPDPVQRSALLFTGASVPEVPGAPPDGAIITIPGRHRWEAAVSSRLRYALVVGVSPVAARVQTVDEGGGGGLPTRVSKPVGVLGIVPPALRTPVEDEVWRKFERVPGVSRREDL